MVLLEQLLLEKRYWPQVFSSFSLYTKVRLILYCAALTRITEFLIFPAIKIYFYLAIHSLYRTFKEAAENVVQPNPIIKMDASEFNNQMYSNTEHAKFNF